MNSLCFEIQSNEEIWYLIDKNIDHVFVHKFIPNGSTSWWKTNLKMPNDERLDNIEVRNMAFDIQTNLEGLKKILEFNTHQLRIYQFEKPVPDTLNLDYLTDQNREKILLQNGLKHIYFCDFEFITIESNDTEFLKSIENSETFKDRIAERKNSFDK